MNDNQKSILDYVMPRVKDGKQDDAKKLLESFFEKQDKGKVDNLFLMQLYPKALAMIKPEHLGEVKEMLNKYGSQATKK